MKSTTIIASILFSGLLLFAAHSASAEEVSDSGIYCYVCDQCSSVNVANTPKQLGNYCKKTVFAGETSRSAATNCIPIPKSVYCCNTHLCNGSPKSYAVAPLLLVSFAAAFATVGRVFA